MKKKIILIVLVSFLMGILSACSSSKEEISIDNELISNDAPVVGSNTDEIEEYWKNSYNYKTAKEQISIEHTSKFNSNFQENTKVYYGIDPKGQCNSIEINFLEFEELKNKEMKDVLSIAKSLINKQTKFNIDKEELELEIDSSGNRIISYYLYLNSDDIVDDNYKGNVNGDSKPYEKIRIRKANDYLYLQVGSLSTKHSKHYKETEYIKLEPKLINNESVINEILNVENIDSIKKEYLVKNEE